MASVWKSVAIVLKLTSFGVELGVGLGGINVAGALSSKTVDATNFQITVGSTTYTYAGGTSTTPLATLASYINSLGANVNANVVAIDSTNWNLSIQGTKTGISNKISITK